MDKDIQNLIFASRELAAKTNKEWTIDYFVFSLLSTDLAENQFKNIRELREKCKYKINSKTMGNYSYDTVPKPILQFLNISKEVSLSNLLTKISHLPGYQDFNCKGMSFNYLHQTIDSGNKTGDLGEEMTTKTYDPVIGREQEVERLISILSRKKKNNPVLVGEAGTGKTAIVEFLATRIASGKVPEHLRVPIFSLNVASIVAGTTYRGEYEDKVNKLIKLAKKNKMIIFIDEIHNIVGAGATISGTQTLAEILKPELARGDIRIIGATTNKEYQKYIEKDQALERRFQPIQVQPPDNNTCIEILRKSKEKYQEHHKVYITDNAILTAVNIGDRYIKNNRNMPDKIIDILDEACSSFPPASDELNEKYEELSNKIKQGILNLKIFLLYGDLSQSNFLKNKLIPEFGLEQNKLLGIRMVTEKQILEVITRISGTPVNKLSEDQVNSVLNLNTTLNHKVIGQLDAVNSVSRVILRNKAGLSPPGRPIGCFLFLGPTGVGKTELAKALTEELFGNEKCMLRLDMSEYQESHQTSRLIGAPPGYIGYEEEGRLTEYVKKNPYSLILMDEAEKAHPQVWNLMLSVFDDARLTNNKGQVIDFSNTIIILTSNLDNNRLKLYFRPEMLNRFDDIVLFNSLTMNELKPIIHNLTAKIFEPLKQKNIRLTLSEEALDKILKDGWDPKFGARPLRRYIERTILTDIGTLILKEQVKEEIKVNVVKDNFVYG